MSLSLYTTSLLIHQPCPVPRGRKYILLPRLWGGLGSSSVWTTPSVPAMLIFVGVFTHSLHSPSLQPMSILFQLPRWLTIYRDTYIRYVSRCFRLYLGDTIRKRSAITINTKLRGYPNLLLMKLIFWVPWRNPSTWQLTANRTVRSNHH